MLFDVFMNENIRSAKTRRRMCVVVQDGNGHQLTGHEMTIVSEIAMPTAVRCHRNTLIKTHDVNAFVRFDSYADKVRVRRGRVWRTFAEWRERGKTISAG